MNIKLWRYLNDFKQMLLNKEPYCLTLTLLPLKARSRSQHFRVCIEKCKQPEMLVSSKETTLSM